MPANRLSSEQLLELIALGEKATARPWYPSTPAGFEYGKSVADTRAWIDDARQARDATQVRCTRDCTPKSIDDAAFIAASANAASDIAAEVIELRAEVEALTSESEELDDLKSDITSLMPYTEDTDEDDQSCLPAAQCVEAAAEELTQLRTTNVRLASEVAALKQEIDLDLEIISTTGRLLDERNAECRALKNRIGGAPWEG